VKRLLLFLAVGAVVAFTAGFAEIAAAQGAAGATAQLEDKNAPWATRPLQRVRTA
jgi:hypothetical protein